ncbi:MAG TPA: hypothetical protein VIB00_18780 [Pyrinomonadaceae bacterium]
MAASVPRKKHFQRNFRQLSDRQQDDPFAIVLSYLSDTPENQSTAFGTSDSLNFNQARLALIVDGCLPGLATQFERRIVSTTGGDGEFNAPNIALHCELSKHTFQETLVTKWQKN